MITRSRRGGFSLIELVVVMFGISLVLGMLGSMIWSVLRLERAGSDSFTRMQQQIQLAERFRQDVAQAEASPEFAQDFTASPVCMILRQEDGALLVYRWHEGSLRRQVLREGTEETQDLPVGGEDVRIEFSRRGGVLALEVHGPNRSPLVIAAALGGDRS